MSEETSADLLAEFAPPADGQPCTRLVPSVAIEMTMRRAMAETHAKGLAVAVVDAGQVVYIRAFGRRNDDGEPLRDDTVMVAASLTKPAFAYFVMKLVDE